MSLNKTFFDPQSGSALQVHYLHVKTVGDDGPDGDEIDEDDLDDGLPVIPLAGGGQPSHCLQPVQGDGSQAQGRNVHRGPLSANKIVLGS